jgi:hypothetical protein
VIRPALAGLLGSLTLTALAGAFQYGNWGISLHESASDHSDPRGNGLTCLFSGTCWRPLPIQVIRIADQVPMYATFQSHNQKVVENRYGIFLTYLDKVKPISGRCPHFPTPPCYDSPYLWKLVRSTDSGRTFRTVYEAIADTRAPSLETDSSGNLYLFVTEYSPGHDDAFLYRFRSAQSFDAPQITRIPGAASAKYTSYLDDGRHRLYYMNSNGGVPNFYIFDLNGALLHSAQLLRNGPHADVQYPHLAMSGATLCAAWTTSLESRYLYWDIHFMCSEDGGLTWRKGDGTPLSLPVVADETGAADSLILSDEYGSHNWLASMAAHGGYLHFMYESQLPVIREHYLRFDPVKHSLDVNIYPVLQGESLSVRNLDGFFASDTGAASGLLYVVSTDFITGGANRIVVLASADSGRTWFDYAVSPPFSRPYSIGGARLARRGASILGTFTNLVLPDSGATANVNEVWFFRVGARL